MRLCALRSAAFVASLVILSSFGTIVHAQVTGSTPGGGTGATTVRMEPGTLATSAPLRPIALRSGSPILMNWRNVSLLRSYPVLVQLWRRGLLR